jgi:hypothetical protein
MSERLRVEPYCATMRRAWDDHVTTSRAPHFMFLRDYMEYHADRFEDCSLMIFEGARLVAVLPASRHGDVVRSHGGLTFGGFVTDDAMTAHKMLATFETATAHFRRLGIRRLIYAPVPHIYHEIPAEEDVYALFRLGARLIQRDLSSTIARGRQPRPSKGRRSSAKRAANEEFSIERSLDFQAFMDIARTMLEARFGQSPTHTGEELARLATAFPESIRLFTASDGSTQLAGIVVYETRCVAHTQYIAASDEGRKRGALDAILAHLLTDVYASKRFFDFGISTERDGHYLNSGLVRNKESYGGRGITYDRYELEL